jgi:hypothetical protein
VLFEGERAVEENLPLFFVIGVMHQWRLAALFVISGMGTAFAFSRRSWQTYLKERCVRLLVPLLFVTYILFWGVFTPVDTTARLLSIFPGIEAMPYGHLWFIYNLFIYSVILTPLFVHARDNPDGKLVGSVRALLGMRYGLGLLLLPPLLLALNGILLKPWAFGEVGMWWEFPRYLLYFAFGYLMITAREEYFPAIDRIRIPVTIATPVLSLLFFVAGDALGVPLLMEGGWVAKGYPAFSAGATIGTVLQAYHAWFWCLLIFAWGSKLLNRPSCTLTYLNQAVYPTYVVHLHVTFIAIGVIVRLGFGYYVGLALGTVVVIALCLTIFEIVKRAKLARALFGIKPLPGPVSEAGPGGWRILASIVFHLLSFIIIIALMVAILAAFEE